LQLRLWRSRPATATATAAATATATATTALVATALRNGGRLLLRRRPLRNVQLRLPRQQLRPQPPHVSGRPPQRLQTGALQQRDQLVVARHGGRPRPPLHIRPEAARDAWRVLAVLVGRRRRSSN